MTFKATQTLGGATNLLATWNEPLTFAAGGDSYGVASFTLTNVPAGTTHLSAKSPWNLRKRLPVPFLAGASTASFTGDSLLPGGDINGSDLVDIEDYFQLAASWYQADASSDIDGSGLVDIDDYFILSDHWYQASEPE